MAPIAWLPWSAETFARARAEAKPVLLSVAPTWCRFSRDMDRTCYADPEICSIVNSRFVAIRVDPDRRPDVSQRYSLGGWPTTAFLTPGGQVLGGGTHVEIARLAGILVRVSDAFASGRHIGTRPAPTSRVRQGAPSPPSVDALVEQVMAAFDERHGGFGGHPKFPLAAPIRLAIALYGETGHNRYYDVAIRSLDAMGWGPLYDEQQGGFFSYAHNVDWSAPNEAKLLDVNASLLALYVEALEAFGLSRYGERAEDLLRYTQTWLADPVDGGWAASQQGTDDYARDVSSGTQGPEAPTVDRTLYSAWNGMMASSALHAGRVLGDVTLSEFALKSIERVLLLAYKPGAGVAHYVDAGGPEVRGLLDDQVAMAIANLDAYDATGNVVYEMMAEELALHAIRTLWDPESDGFFDRTADPRRDIGLLKEPLKPFSVNCAAARMLQRLAQASGSAEFQQYAQRTLLAVADQATAEGPLAAEYVLAIRQSPLQ